MCADTKLIEDLQKAIAQVQAEVNACNEERARVLRKVSNTQQGGGPGAGMGRNDPPGLPDCTVPEEELRRLQDELQRARDGKPALPPFLSTEGRSEMESIENRQEAAALLGPMLAIGTAISAFETLAVGTVTTGGHDLEDATKAMLAVPQIERERTKTQIDLYLIRSGTEMSKQEREYWERVRDSLK